MRYNDLMNVPALSVAGLLVVCTSSGCTKGDNVPSYIEIPSVVVSTNELQGAATSKITDVWVSVNDELLGVWELPARVPALYEGNVEVRVVPAIKRNGMYDDRLRYPFMEAYIADIDLVKEQTTRVDPVVTYFEQTDFWIESFDDPGTLVSTTPASDTTLLRFTPAQAPDLVLDDSPCGGFVLEGDRDYIRLFTDEDFDVFGGPIFLELDYRTNIPFTIGVIYEFNGLPNAQPYVIVTPTLRGDGSTFWNKIYVDLSPVFNLGVTGRDIFIEATLPSGTSTAQVLLENIKIVRISS